MKSFGNLIVPAKKNYKTDTGWLRAVWRKNREFIEERTGDYKTFRDAVRSYQEFDPKVTTRQALQKLSRSSAAGFQTRNEHQQNLFENAMKGQKTEFFKATGERFDERNLHYISPKYEINPDGTFKKVNGRKVRAPADQQPKNAGMWQYNNNKGEAVAYFSDIRTTGYKAKQARYMTP